MASKFAIVWMVLSLLATNSIAQTGCPLLDREGSWNIHSQADADKLKTCHTFKGILNIDGRNASSPIIVDGPVHINGDLNLLLDPQTDPRLSVLSMKSLVDVDGEIYMQQNLLYDYPPKSNLTTLDFPGLKSVSRYLQFKYLYQVDTINLPCLEKVRVLELFNLPLLRRLNVPKLWSAAQLDLGMLPSLKTLSFDSGLQDDMSWYYGGGLYIYNTSLTSVEGLNFSTASILSISFNKDLANLSLPNWTLASDQWGFGRINIEYNYEQLVLNLPRLKGVIGPMTLSGVGAVNIPELVFVERWLEIGAINRRMDLKEYSNYCLPTPLTTFSAPKLITAPKSLTFDCNPQLVNISFPALRSAGDIKMNNTAAVNLAEGISLPALERVQNVQILGTAPYCTLFDDLRSRGVIVHNYWCGNTSNQSEDIDLSCVIKELEGVELTHRIKSWSEMLLFDCYGTLSGGCMPGYPMRVRLVVKIGCVLAAVAVAWYVRGRRIAVQSQAMRTKVG